MATISFAITACNEHVELEKLLSTLYLNIKGGDEIIVQLDTTATPEVRKVVSKPDPNVVPFKVIEFALDNDFASFKNNIKNHCSKDWIFFIDADETLNYYFMKNLNGLTQAHIDKWRWFVDDNGWVNWPDYQTRICANKPEIQWVNKVHERLTGFKTSAQLPALEEWSLTHIKDIERQEKQNNFYNKIG